MIDIEHLFLRPPEMGARIVELFAARPGTIGQHKGAALFVHGHQETREGAREMVESGTLAHFAESLNILTAAVSQPGYGESDGPPDFCGPVSQAAVRAGLAFLRSQSGVDPSRVLLHGFSRGAVVSAIVAAEDPDLAAVVLISGVYDLAAVYETSPQWIQQNIEREAGITEEAFAARSGLRRASSIRTQTLVIHGKKDERAPVGQAQAFAKAVEEGGAEVSLKLLDSGHFIPEDDRREAVEPLFRCVLG